MIRIKKEIIHGQEILVKVFPSHADKVIKAFAEIREAQPTQHIVNKKGEF